MKELEYLIYEMLELEPQMYNFYLNKLRLLTVTSPSLFRTKHKNNRLEGIEGPHNIDVISIIFGSLLGNAQVENLSTEQGTIVIFFQEGIHTEYIFFLHKLFSYLGYCTPKLPKITKKLGVKGKIIKKVNFST